MKKIISIIVMLIMMFSIGGCVRLATPEELMKAPEINRKQREIKEAVEKFIPRGATLVIPKNSKRESAMMEVSFEKDSKEIVTFYKRNDNMGILVIAKKDGVWELESSIEETAEDISEFIIRDIKGNGIPEILVGYEKKQENHEIMVYGYEDGQIKRIYRSNYDKFAIGDLDGDSKEEIVIARTSKEDMSTRIRVFKYMGKSIREVAYPFDVKDDVPYKMEVGNINTNKKGLFVDMVTSDNQGYTEVLTLQGEVRGKYTLTEIIAKKSDGKSPYVQDYPVGSKDIDEDGIIEIATLKKPVGYENFAISDIPYIQCWNKLKDDMTLDCQLEEYDNYELGYSIKIPVKWMNKYTIKIEDTGRNVGFYYINKDMGKMIPMLKLYSISKEDWEIKKEDMLLIEYEIIDESEGDIIIAEKIDKSKDLTGELKRDYVLLKEDLGDLKTIIKKLEI